jgi:rod shape-determining protein MreD
MNARQVSATYLIGGSFVLALLLSVMPIPDWAQHLRPQWLTLVLIYWCLMAPERVGITTAWVSGLLLDAMTGNLLGAHALSLSLVAFITLNIHQRTRIFPLWQQSLVILALITLEHLIQFWITGIARHVTPGLEFWLAPVVGLLIWPWLFIIMSEAQHRLHKTI